jgi:2-amino-4-hydroxy-6-hydroxymethyldihydropteridine diphosphokinase
VSIWQPVYIGVGSNLDDPGAQVRFAVSRLEALAASRVVCVSPLYGSRAFGPIAQPDYVNAVVGALTQLDSHKLLADLLALEGSLGRPARHQKWGPRVIDLDLLIYGRERSCSGFLELPHPGMAARNFVLFPLADIAPDLHVPGLGRVAELAARVSRENIWPL